MILRSGGERPKVHTWERAIDTRIIMFQAAGGYRWLLRLAVWDNAGAWSHNCRRGWTDEGTILNNQYDAYSSVDRWERWERWRWEFMMTYCSKGREAWACVVALSQQHKEMPQWLALPCPGDGVILWDFSMFIIIITTQQQRMVRKRSAWHAAQRRTTQRMTIQAIQPIINNNIAAVRSSTTGRYDTSCYTILDLQQHHHATPRNTTQHHATPRITQPICSISYFSPSIVFSLLLQLLAFSTTRWPPSCHPLFPPCMAMMGSFGSTTYSWCNFCMFPSTTSSLSLSPYNS